MLAITWNKSDQPATYPIEPKLHFLNESSSLKPSAESVLIYDCELLKNSAFKTLLKKFKFSISIKAGESAKSLASYGSTLEKLIKLSVASSSHLHIYSAGGGSVGDLVGFVASTFRRGVRLSHIPTTWLAAIDSAYGGKTALNLNSIKNQVGNFYFAESVFVIRELLSTQSSKHLRASMGEALKTSLLSGSSLWSELNDLSSRSSDEEIENKIWEILPQLVQFKLKIVDRDPFERKRLRTTLNFGHTWGHVAESSLKQSHGAAVLSGLRWAIEFSLWCKLLQPKAYCEILESNAGSFLPSTRVLLAQLKQLPRWEATLVKDKKALSKSEVNLVLLKGIGRPVVIPVPIEDIRKFNQHLTRYSSREN